MEFKITDPKLRDKIMKLCMAHDKPGTWEYNDKPKEIYKVWKQGDNLIVQLSKDTYYLRGDIIELGGV